MAGSTGGVGQIAVAKLSDRGFRVRALTRNRSSAQELFGSAPGIDIVEVDLRDAAALQSAAVFDGVAGAIVTIGTTAFPSARCAAYLFPKQTMPLRLSSRTIRNGFEPHVQKPGLLLLASASA